MRQRRLTDTWFAEHGTIFNIGVYPYPRCRWRCTVPISRGNASSSTPRISGSATPCILKRPAGTVIPSSRRPSEKGSRRRFPLSGHHLLGSAGRRIDRNLRRGHRGPYRRAGPSDAGADDPARSCLCRASVETDLLGLQCGIQDQLCSAYGGINFIEMFRYPHPRYHRYRYRTPHGGSSNGALC